MVAEAVDLARQEHLAAVERDLDDRWSARGGATGSRRPRRGPREDTHCTTRALSREGLEFLGIRSTSICDISDIASGGVALLCRHGGPGGRERVRCGAELPPE